MMMMTTTTMRVFIDSEDEISINRDQSLLIGHPIDKNINNVDPRRDTQDF